MGEADTKRRPTVTVHIQPGAVTPTQRHAWSKFWRRLAEVKASDRTEVREQKSHE